MSMSDAGRIRVRVHYTGRVQGVGFRAAVLGLSRRTAVVGYVRNLSDGRVEIEAEGVPRHVDDFLESVRLQMMGFIGSIERASIPVLEAERIFEIRE